MLKEACELGFDSCIVIHDGPLPAAEITALRGWIISEDSVKAVLARMRNVPSGIDLVMVEARDAAFNRGALSLRGIDILRGISRAPPKSFDHVCARLGAQHQIAIDLNLYPLLHERGGARQEVIRRYEDLIQLCRRFKFPLTISSDAGSILDQRSVREISSLCSLFGMHAWEVTQALATPGEITNRKGPVEVVQ
ncbi:MAG: ribonuclease P [Methanomicrobiales archaeon]|nr:ribonuclease P [Methanomicrobiales archaeon]